MFGALRPIEEAGACPDLGRFRYSIEPFQQQRPDLLVR
jgi:hypothetical protein